MKKKSSIPHGSPHQHRQRLSNLIKGLKNAEGKVIYNGYQYDLNAVHPELNYKDLIQQITGMEDSAFHRYFDPVIQNNTAYSSSGKTLSEPAKFIHTIRPYLTIDGGAESQKNSLLEKGALSLENHKPVKPGYEEVYSNVGSVPVVTAEAVPKNISEIYNQYFEKLQREVWSILIFPQNILQSLLSIQMNFTRYISDFKNEYDNDYKFDESFILTYVNLITVYTETLKSSPSSKTILPGIKNLKTTESLSESTKVYREKFNDRVSALKFTEIPTDVLINARYELMWQAHTDKFDYSDWPNELKALMLIINIEEASIISLIMHLNAYLIKETKFIIESSSDGKLPIHLHRELSFSDLFTILIEYQLDDLDSIFDGNLRNIISGPIHRIPIFDLSKVESLQPRINEQITRVLTKLYLRKIYMDLVNTNKISSYEWISNHLSSL